MLINYIKHYRRLYVIFFVMFTFKVLSLEACLFSVYVYLEILKNPSTDCVSYQCLFELRALIVLLQNR